MALFNQKPAQSAQSAVPTGQLPVNQKQFEFPANLNMVIWRVFFSSRVFESIFLFLNRFPSMKNFVEKKLLIDKLFYWQKFSGNEICLRKKKYLLAQIRLKFSNNFITKSTMKNSFFTISAFKPSFLFFLKINTYLVKRSKGCFY